MGTAGHSLEMAMMAMLVPLLLVVSGPFLLRVVCFPRVLFFGLVREDKRNKPRYPHCSKGSFFPESHQKLRETVGFEKKDG